MSSYGKDPDGPCKCPSPECPVKRHHEKPAETSKPLGVPPLIPDGKYDG